MPKLFGALAFLALALEFIGRSRPVSVGDLHLHDTYYVIYHPRLLLFVALASAVFACTYFASAQWSSRSVDDSLTLVHFILVALGLTLIALGELSVWNRSVIAALDTSEKRTQLLLWPTRALAAGIVAVALGTFVFLMNVCKVAISSARLK